MGGLGLGSAVLGRRAEVARRPLLLYGNLELLIAGFAAITPLLVLLVRSIYSATGGTMVLGHGVGTIVRLLMAGLVLVGPTFLMGGTLPAAARSIASAFWKQRAAAAHWNPLRPRSLRSTFTSPATKKPRIKLRSPIHAIFWKSIDYTVPGGYWVSS